MNLIDLHCDTAAKLLRDPALSLAANTLSVDLDALEKAGSMAQVFALFINMEKTPSRAGTAFAMLDRLKSQLEANADRIAWAGCGKDIRANSEAGKLSALISLEEGGIIEGSLETLRAFYEGGARLLTLSWNHPNELCFPHGKEHGHKGLTSFGLDVLEEMNRLGMIADVSHMSEAGFRDVARHCKTAFMATHSNCRALCGHTRNLTDGQIRSLADKGGVMGICVVRNFLLDGDGDGGDEGRVEAFAAHVRHAHAVGGLDVVAVGTDFDGTAVNHEFSRIDDVAKVEPLLRQAGFTTDMLERIYWRNALRVIDDVLG